MRLLMLRPFMPSQQQLPFLALPVWLVAMLFFPHIIAPLPPPQQLMAKAGAALSISRAAVVANRLFTGRLLSAQRSELQRCTLPSWQGQPAS